MHPRVLTLLTILLVGTACSSAKHYEMRGQVLSVNRDKLEILVKHEDIVGLMPAMTMPYKVASPALLDNLGPGDLITTDLEVDNNQGVITTITKTGVARPDMPAPAAPAKSGFELIKPGAEVPDQAFIDQEGRKRTFSEIRAGRAVALTFIYTTCPMPTFCPMMDRNFVDVQRQIKEQKLGGKVHLLSVSFDPKNDTPPVMKAHAQGLGFDPALWTFVTGDRDEIDRLAMNFGVTLIRGEAANPDEIGHTLRTAIVDRDGKLVKIYTGNEWTPAELVADIAALP
jgi:protein SCO1/2